MLAWGGRGLGCVASVGGGWRVGLDWFWRPRALALLGLGYLGGCVVLIRPFGRSVRWLVVVGLFLVQVPHQVPLLFKLLV